VGFKAEAVVREYTINYLIKNFEGYGVLVHFKWRPAYKTSEVIYSKLCPGQIIDKSRASYGGI
jgi:hypothetical protein